jgi:hypothetical protein
LAESWELNTNEQQDNFLTQAHRLTAVFWHSEMQCTQQDEAEARKLISAVPKSSSSTPTLAANFTDWHHHSMVDAVEFCIKNDKNPPDLLA